MMKYNRQALIEAIEAKIEAIEAHHALQVARYEADLETWKTTVRERVNAIVDEMFATDNYEGFHGGYQHPFVSLAPPAGPGRIIGTAGHKEALKQLRLMVGNEVEIKSQDNFLRFI